jgi:integrase
MRLLLNDRFCDRAKPAEGAAQTDYWDSKVPGLGLRVGRGKTWTLLYLQAGKRKRLTFGAYPAISLAEARRRALEARGAIAEGLAPTVAKGGDTLRTIAEEYQRRDGHKLRTAKDRRGVLERHVYPTLGDRPIAEIRRSEIVRLLDVVEDASGARMADITLAIIRKIMNWHASRSDEFRSPIVRGMSRRPPTARERILTDEEIRAIWSAPAMHLSEVVFARLVKFILLTATRRNEAAQARWAEINGDDWTIPKARYKTGLDHLVPLSGAAKAILNTIEASPTFVFTVSGVLPISSFSSSKAAFDKAIGVQGWTLHDLRRTARSLMSRAGVPSDHAERCLGHVIPGVRGVYDRHEYHAEKARAYEALAGLIDRIVNPSDNVVPLAR